MAHFRIDPRASRLTIRVAAAGMLSAFGHSPTIAARGYSGDLGFEPGSFAQAHVAFKASAALLDVQDAGNEKDRREIERVMRDEVLEAAKFPDIAFASTEAVPSIEGDGRVTLAVTGRLTLHGVTRTVGFPAQVSLTGSLLRANGAFTVRQTDFDIKLVSVAGGALKVKDELQCAFDIVAREEG